MNEPPPTVGKTPEATDLKYVDSGCAFPLFGESSSLSNQTRYNGNVRSQSSVEMLALERFTGVQAATKTDPHICGKYGPASSTVLACSAVTILVIKITVMQNAHNLPDVYRTVKSSVKVGSTHLC